MDESVNGKLNQFPRTDSSDGVAKAISPSASEEEFVLSSYLKCSICDFNLNSISRAYKIVSHQLLGLPTCLLCAHEFEESYIVDENNSKDGEILHDLCSCCGLGGDLFVCGNADCSGPHSFCFECVKRLVGEDTFDEIGTDDLWHCFVCKPSPLLDERKQALELGRNHTIYNGSYFEVNTAIIEEDAAEYLQRVTEEDILREIDILSLVSDEVDTASRMLESQEIEIVRIQIRSEFQSSAAPVSSQGSEVMLEKSVSEEVERYVAHWQYHHDLMLCQEAEVEDRLSLLGYDPVSLPHRRLIHAMMEREVEASSREIYKPELIFKSVSRKQVSPTLLKDDKLLWTNWYDGNEVHVNSSNSPGFDYSGVEYTRTHVKSDQFVKYYDNHTAVPINRYPQSFNSIVPIPLLKALYYKGQSNDEEIELLYSDAIKKFKIPPYVIVVMKYASEFVASRALSKFPFCGDVHPAVTKVFESSEIPEEWAVVCDRFNIDSEYGTVDDLGDTFETYQKIKAEKILKLNEVASKVKPAPLASNDFKQLKAQIEVDPSIGEFISACYENPEADFKLTKSIIKKVTEEEDSRRKRVGSSVVFSTMTDQGRQQLRQRTNCIAPITDETDFAEMRIASLNRVVTPRKRFYQSNHTTELASGLQSKKRTINSSSSESSFEVSVGVEGASGCSNEFRCEPQSEALTRVKRKFPIYIGEPFILSVGNFPEVPHSVLSTTPQKSSANASFPSSSTAIAPKTFVSVDIIDLCDETSTDDDEPNIITSNVKSNGLSGSIIKSIQSAPPPKASAHPTAESSTKPKAKKTSVDSVPLSTSSNYLPFTFSHTNYKSNQEEINRKLAILFDTDFTDAFTLNYGSRAEPPITLPLNLALTLKDHQKEAVRFLWKNVVGTISSARRKNEGSGCIIAHCMGLGKTLTVIAFAVTLCCNPNFAASDIIQTSSGRDASTLQRISSPTKTTSLTKITNTVIPRKLFHTILILAPKNTLQNWLKEFREWIRSTNMRNDLTDKVWALERTLPVSLFASDNVSMDKRLAELKKWHEKGGVMIMGYEIFRVMLTSASYKNVLTRDSDMKTARSYLQEGPDVVVADEAHIIKDGESQLSDKLCHIRTKKRIALTGSPLQNNLEEYFCMVNWVRPRYLGSKQDFKRKFVIAHLEGQHKDASIEQVLNMKKRSYVLHKKLLPIVDRKDISTLTLELPPKREFVIYVKMSKYQVLLYELFLNLVTQKTSKSPKAFLFKAFQTFLRLGNHPACCVHKTLDYEMKVDKEVFKSQAASVLQKPNCVQKKEKKPVANVWDKLRQELTVPTRICNNVDHKEVIRRLKVDAKELQRALFDDKGDDKGLGSAERANADEVDSDDSDGCGGSNDEDYDEIQFEPDDNSKNYDDVPGAEAYADQKKTAHENCLIAAKNIFIDMDDGDVRGKSSNTQPDETSPFDLLKTTMPKFSVGRSNDYATNNDNNNSNKEAVDDDSSNDEGSKGCTDEIAKNGLMETASFSETEEQQQNLNKIAVVRTCEPYDPATIHNAQLLPLIPPTPSADSLDVDRNIPTQLSHQTSTPKSDFDDVGGSDDVDADRADTDDDEDEVSQRDWWRLTSIAQSEGLNEETLHAAPNATHREIFALSSKFILLFNLLKLSVQVGDKMLVFSQSLHTLDLIEYFLNLESWYELVEEQDKSRVGNEYTFNKNLFSAWKKGDQYFRIDGRSVGNRQINIDKFNTNPMHKLYLISTKAGNMGINLHKANRVVIFDSSWNPAHDMQAIFRCYRYKQDKSVYVYRLIGAGSMEENVYKKQVDKQALSARVIDAQTPDSQFDSREKTELMTFHDSEESSESIIERVDKVLNLSPKDEVLLKVIHKNICIIAGLQDQSSLLEDKKEHRLTPEEQAQAEADLQRESDEEKRRAELAATVRQNMGLPSLTEGSVRRESQQTDPEVVTSALNLEGGGVT